MPRNYGQVCGIARSLDLLGERWTLLVIRELLLGPKRFSTLEAALPGIGPNLLTTRLSTLIDEGLVERSMLAPPASARGYRLTVRGEGLREPVKALSVWGFELIRDPEESVGRGELARGSWLASSLAAAAARSRSGTDAAGSVVNFDIGGDRFYIAVDDRRANVRHGERLDATASLTCDLGSFYEMTLDPSGAPDPAVAEVLAVIAP